MQNVKSGFKDLAERFWKNPTFNLGQVYEDQFGRYAGTVNQEISQL
jgi:hypothetical protein